MAVLTKKQKKVFEFIKLFSEKNGISPTYKEIAAHIEVSSFNTVHDHLVNLEKKGLIRVIENQPRGIEVVSSEPMVQVKILGEIAAGQPIEIIENEEIVAVPGNKIPSSANVYALRVVGDSMIDENINDGDLVLVRQQETAENGQKVVALIDNHEATLKKFYREKGHIRLQPANKKIEPLIFRGERDVSIQGIVFDVIRKGSTLEVEIFNYKETKRYKKLPLNKIIKGDVVEKMRKLPSESCDIIIIDPPYNIGKDFGNNKDKRELSEYIAWCKEWMKESIRVLKPTGTMFIYGFSEILAHLSVEISIKKRWLIWHYTNKNVASLSFWQRSHESIICAWKDKPIFNKDKIREPYTEGFLNGAAGKVRKGTLGRFSNSGKETVYKAHKNGALPRDVIKIPALAGGAGMVERWFLCKTCNKVCESRSLRNHENHEIIKHPTQKPLELSRKLILSAKPKKDGVVLVPFVGTGSECAAAKELRQNYIGFEINPDYIRIAEKFVSSAKPSVELI